MVTGAFPLRTTQLDQLFVLHNLQRMIGAVALCFIPHDSSTSTSMCSTYRLFRRSLNDLFRLVYKGVQRLHVSDYSFLLSVSFFLLLFPPLFTLFHSSYTSFNLLLVLRPFISISTHPLTLLCGARRDRRDDTPFSVVQYIDDYRESLKAGRFAPRRLSGHAKRISNVRNGRVHDTAIKSGRNVGGTAAVAVRRN